MKALTLILVVLAIGVLLGTKIAEWKCEPDPEQRKT